MHLPSFPREAARDLLRNHTLPGNPNVQERLQRQLLPAAGPGPTASGPAPASAEGGPAAVEPGPLDGAMVRVYGWPMLCFGACVTWGQHSHGWARHCRHTCAHAHTLVICASVSRCPSPAAFHACACLLPVIPVPHLMQPRDDGASTTVWHGA